MFEYSLSNGRKQFKQGFIYLVASVLLIILFLILRAIIKSPDGLLAINIIFYIIIPASSLFSFIKIIFGAVVYHAERTSNKTNEVLLSEEKTTKLEEKLKQEQKIIERDK